MSGLLALLDDVAAIAKMAATQIDDIYALAAKAGTKSAGVVIDDAAVTPKYVHGLPAARELPIVLQIARGSLFNKLVILLPAALLISAVAPWLLTPLLMLGGAYLCYEGAEKILHAILPHHDDDNHSNDRHGDDRHGDDRHGDDRHEEGKPLRLDAAHLEKERVAGAIKTDFVLSAEITAIALAAIETDSLWRAGIVLAIVAVGITALVYGSVAILVKADDVGLRMAETGRFDATRALGRQIVFTMPKAVTAIAIIGTGAMLWVGGSILNHGMKDLGFGAIYDAIHLWAESAAHAAVFANGFVTWLVTASLDGLAGLLFGGLIIPVVTYGVGPLTNRLKQSITAFH